MKFKVRPGYVVHIKKVADIGGKPVTQESSYFEGDEFDCDDKTAKDHAHKLEPVCKKADGYLTAQHPIATLPTLKGGEIDYQKLALAMMVVQPALAAANAKAKKAETTTPEKDEGEPQ